jgi:hypothetical protein
MELKKDKKRIEIIKPFGPSIIKFQMPMELVNEINSYIDNVILDNSKIEKLDYSKSLAGQVTQELILEIEFMKKIKWADFLMDAFTQWLKYENPKKKLKNFNLIRSWVVRQFKNEYNPVHWHGGQISGVGYLKVPKDMSKPSKKNHVETDGKLVLIDGYRSLFSNSIFSIEPKVGDFYMFPNHLMHTVYPFFGTDEERRSVSFNADLDPETKSF